MYRYIGKTRVNLNDCNGNYKDVSIRESNCNTIELKRLVYKTLAPVKNLIVDFDCSLTIDLDESHLKTIILSKNKLSNIEIDNISALICEYYLEGPGENLNLTIFETFLEDNQENGWIADIEHKNEDEIYFDLYLDKFDVPIAPLLEINNNPSININNIVDIVVNKLRENNLNSLEFSERVKGIHDYDDLLCIAADFVDLN